MQKERIYFKNENKKVYLKLNFDVQNHAIPFRL